MDIALRVAAQFLNCIQSISKRLTEFKVRDELVMQLVSSELAAQIERQNDPLRTSEALADEIGFHEHGYDTIKENAGVVGKLARSFELKKNVSKALGAKAKKKGDVGGRGGKAGASFVAAKEQQQDGGGDGSPTSGGIGGTGGPQKNRVAKLGDILAKRTGKEKLQTLTDFSRDGWSFEMSDELGFLKGYSDVQNLTRARDAPMLVLPPKLRVQEQHTVQRSRNICDRPQTAPQAFITSKRTAGVHCTPGDNKGGLRNQLGMAHIVRLRGNASTTFNGGLVLNYEPNSLKGLGFQCAAGEKAVAFSQQRKKRETQIVLRGKLAEAEWRAESARKLAARNAEPDFRVELCLGGDKYSMMASELEEERKRLGAAKQAQVAAKKAAEQAEREKKMWEEAMESAGKGPRAAEKAAPTLDEKADPVVSGPSETKDADAAPVVPGTSASDVDKSGTGSAGLSGSASLSSKGRGRKSKKKAKKVESVYEEAPEEEALVETIMTGAHAATLTLPDEEDGTETNGQTLEIVDEELALSYAEENAHICCNKVNPHLPWSGSMIHGISPPLSPPPHLLSPPSPTSPLLPPPIPYYDSWSRSPTVTFHFVTAHSHTELKGRYIRHIARVPGGPEGPEFLASKIVENKAARLGAAAQELKTVCMGPNLNYDGMPFVSDQDLLSAAYAENRLNVKWQSLRVGGTVTWRTLYSLLNSRAWNNICSG